MTALFAERKTNQDKKKHDTSVVSARLILLVILLALTGESIKHKKISLNMIVSLICFTQTY